MLNLNDLSSKTMAELEEYRSILIRFILDKPTYKESGLPYADWQILSSTANDKYYFLNKEFACRAIHPELIEFLDTSGMNCTQLEEYREKLKAFRAIRPSEEVFDKICTFKQGYTWKDYSLQTCLVGEKIANVNLAIFQRKRFGLD